MKKMRPTQIKYIKKRAMQILSHKQIAQKVKRLTIEILEHNFEEQELIVAGINRNGMAFANQIVTQLKAFSNTPKVTLTHILLNPANPLSSEVTMDIPLESLSGKAILVVDDVANTGRTLFYAMKPLMLVLPKKVEFAVLVDRKHKAFPVHVDYVGLSLATTMREHIDVRLRDVAEQSVFLV